MLAALPSSQHKTVTVHVAGKSPAVTDASAFGDFILQSCSSD